jgi:hypothetical protein
VLAFIHYFVFILHMCFINSFGYETFEVLRSLYHWCPSLAITGTLTSNVLFPTFRCPFSSKSRHH